MSLSIVLTSGEGQTGHLIAELLLTNPDFKKSVKTLTLLTSNTEHSHIESLVSSGAVAVKVTTKKEIMKAMQDAKPNAAMIIPPSSAEKLKEVKELLAVVKEVGGVENAVLLSSAGADLADENMPRLREFVEIEQAVMEAVGAASIIRPGFYAENLLLYNKNAKDQGKLPIPMGTTEKFAPVALGDVALAAAHLLTSENDRGQLVVLTGPKLCNGDELATAASQGLGTKMEYEDIKEEDAKKLLDGQIDAAEQEYLLEYYALVRAGHANYVSTHAFKSLTGQNPQELEEFFKTYAAEFKPKRRKTSGSK